ncbi:MAG: hypothetical protein J6V65_03850, partial [Fibrobacterales bacterium]|nr:hypothetical protein [Fibrobacterales bacterium]
GGASNDEAQSLKSVEGWIDGYGWAGPSDDEFGFTALATGYVLISDPATDRRFSSIGGETYWWTTEFSGVTASAWQYGMNRAQKNMTSAGFMRYEALSVRCVKN